MFSVELRSLFLSIPLSAVAGCLLLSLRGWLIKHPFSRPFVLAVASSAHLNLACENRFASRVLTWQSMQNVIAYGLALHVYIRY